MDGNGTLSVPSDLGVEVSLSFQQDDYTYPYSDGEFTAGQILEALYNEMGSVAGAVCNGDNCESTFNQTEILN